MESIPVVALRRMNGSPETINITEKLQKIGQTSQDYKEAVIEHFKDMDVKVEDWNFSVCKADKEYTVEVNLKLRVSPKKA